MRELDTLTIDAMHALLQQGKTQEYEALVRSNASVIEAVMRAHERIQRIAPDVALSPYIYRAVRILRGDAASTGEAPVQAAA